MLGTNVTAWARKGQIPITFEQLLCGVHPKDIVAALTVLKEITGTAIWERFFAQTEVVQAHYVPFQLGTVLQASLQMAEAAILVYSKEVKDLDFATKAQESFGAFYAADIKNKRQKSGPYTA